MLRFMPDYRRNRVPGGTFFFTVNLLDRHSDLLVTQIDALRNAVSAGAPPRRFPHRRPGRASRPHALPVDPAGRRCRLSRSLARDQDRILEINAYQQTAVTRHGQSGRTRHLAAAVLGAFGPRRSGLRRSPGLHAFQPSQARSGGTPGGLAALLVSTVRGRRAVSGRVDWRPRRATRNGRAAVRRNRRAAQRKAALQPLPPTTGSALRPARTRSGLTSTGDGSRRNALRFSALHRRGAHGIDRHSITAIALYARSHSSP
jgi:hypothetical protein